MLGNETFSLLVLTVVAPHLPYSEIVPIPVEVFA